MRARHRSTSRATSRASTSVIAAFVAAVAVSVGAIAPSLGLAQPAETPPPTPVPVPGGGTSPSPFPSVLRTPPPEPEPPALRAGAAVLVDLDSGRVLFALNATERRPVASLTKIMTAYLVMTRTRPTEVVTVGENAASGRTIGISNLGLVAGERIRVEQLLYALMLQSANDAALALAEHVGGTVEGFVAMMNRAAGRLGLTRTLFASPNGLDDSGYSTARDLARLTRAAYRVPGFAAIVATRAHAVRAPDAEPRVVQNRNALLWLYPGAIGVKTGFTTPAGFCVVATAIRDDERLLAVVLGEPGEPFSDVAALLNFGFTAFERRSLIEAEAGIGTVEIDGRDVAVAAGASLEALVPAGATVQTRVDVDAGVRYPPGRGDVIGLLELSAAGFELGRVPLVVTEVPPPPPPDRGGSWWARAASAVVRAGGAVVGALLD